MKVALCKIEHSLHTSISRTVWRRSWISFVASSLHEQLFWSNECSSFTLFSGKSYHWFIVRKILVKQIMKHGCWCVQLQHNMIWYHFMIYRFLFIHKKSLNSSFQILSHWLQSYIDEKLNSFHGYLENVLISCSHLLPFGSFTASSAMYVSVKSCFSSAFGIFD